MEALTRHFAGWLVASGILAMPSHSLAFQLKLEQVTGEVYALVGSVHGRTYDNHALNNTMGFIVTGKGVILIDSGASSQGAQVIETAIRSVTDQPVKWVINTGVQDHRWLGNGYFKARGAQIIALERTVNAQRELADSHMKRLKRVLKDRLAGTVPAYASAPLAGNKAVVSLGGVKLELIWPGEAHFADDVIVWMPATRTVFAGDLVFMDRLLAIQPGGKPLVTSWAKAFKAMATLKPAHVVPGHGAPGDLAKARADTGDYLDFLVKNIAPAVENMEDIGDVVNRLEKAPAFAHLANFKALQRQNVNRAFLQLEAAQ
ncbi:MAG TPA: MBL fold metallo-hydrolase [Rhizobiales bacterium]|nr:MBL fold metallo-hydrolase [Hyphomicrobiales bacterium]